MSNIFVIPELFAPLSQIVQWHFIFSQILILMDISSLSLLQSNISRASSISVREQGLSCFLTGVVYVVSWLPYTVVCFLFYTNTPVTVSFELIAIYLSKSSTISSPVVYCLIERRFRIFVKERLARNATIVQWNKQMSQLNPMITWVDAAGHSFCNV